MSLQHCVCHLCNSGLLNVWGGGGRHTHTHTHRCARHNVPLVTGNRTDLGIVLLLQEHGSVLQINLLKPSGNFTYHQV
jgi:hypothetical protein